MMKKRFLVSFFSFVMIFSMVVPFGGSKKIKMVDEPEEIIEVGEDEVPL